MTYNVLVLDNDEVVASRIADYLDCDKDFRFIPFVATGRHCFLDAEDNIATNRFHFAVKNGSRTAKEMKEMLGI